MSSMGMMDEGYFVSRTEIFEWVHAVLGHQITTIEQLGKGDIFCKLLEHFHPGSVQLNKVISNPRMEHEYILNLKQLQHGIDKLNQKKKIDILKIAKCKPLENLELAQWLKRFLQSDAPKIDGLRPSLPRSSSKSSFLGKSQYQSRRTSFSKPILPKSSSTILSKERPILKEKQRQAESSKLTVDWNSKDSQKVKQIQSIIRDSSTSDRQKLRSIQQLILGARQNH